MNPDARYDQPLEVTKRSDGKRVYKSARPIKFTANPETSRFYTADQTARLDMISQQAYAMPDAWFKIASAYGRFDGSMFLPKGSTIFIP